MKSSVSPRNLEALCWHAFPKFAHSSSVCRLITENDKLVSPDVRLVHINIISETTFVNTPNCAAIHRAQRPTRGTARVTTCEFCDSRVLLSKRVHRKTVIRDGQEETIVTEDTLVEHDFDGPEELRESVNEVIQKFMEGDDGDQ